MDRGSASNRSLQFTVLIHFKQGHSSFKRRAERPVLFVVVEFLSKFSIFLSNLVLRTYKVITVGDFNIHIAIENDLVLTYGVDLSSLFTFRWLTTNRMGWDTLDELPALLHLFTPIAIWVRHFSYPLNADFWTVEEARVARENRQITKTPPIKGAGCLLIRAKNLQSSPVHPNAIAVHFLKYCSCCVGFWNLNCFPDAKSAWSCVPLIKHGFIHQAHCSWVPPRTLTVPGGLVGYLLYIMTFYLFCGILGANVSSLWLCSADLRPLKW